MKKLLKLLTVVGLSLSFLASCGKRVEKKVDSETLYVKKVENLSDDFIMGMDASSVISLEESGVRYFNFDGKEEDVFKILSDNGINYIRVRVWNDPYDKDGHGYGGGNSDIAKAVEIGKRATKYKMKLLVDFHYSDFWADPSKQYAPKAWEGMDLFEKQEALYQYTLDSMKLLKKNNVDVGMVQLGNENSGSVRMCGEKRFDSYVSLVNQGGKAVKEVYPNALLAVHFANIEKEGTYDYFAEQLDRFECNYDVFGTSYYPYWHGTLENLSNVLSRISTTYNKKVMVLETSYCNSEEDTDFGGNTIGKNNGYPYPFTVAGQANFVHEVIDTVNKIDGGIGVCYWEGVWISVGGNSWEENSIKWRQYGSGWSSGYAKDYDPVDAKDIVGGTVVDNQCFFDQHGKAIESLKVFNLSRFGNEVPTYVDGIEDAYITYRTDDDFELPKTVNSVMSDNSRQPIPVTWEPFDILAAKNAGNGTHTIKGVAEGKTVYCVLTLREYNFVQNSDFEESIVDDSYTDGDTHYKAPHWNVINNGESLGNGHKVEPTKENPQSGKFAFHFWGNLANTLNFDVEQELNLTVSGIYKYQISVMGMDDKNANVYAYVKINDVIQYQETGKIVGYDIWNDMKISEIEYHVGDKISIGFHFDTPTAGSWGDFDDAMFNLVRSL